MGQRQGTASAEVTVWQEEGGHQRPEVEKQPSPAGTDLHPHGGPGADHLLGLTGSGTHHRPRELAPRLVTAGLALADDPVVTSNSTLAWTP